MKLSAAVLFVKTASYILGHLPLSVALWIGRACATVCYVLHKRKWVAYANIRAAFPGKYSAREMKRIVKDSYCNLGQTFVELLRFPYITKNYGERYFELAEGSLERISNALRRGNGVVFLTAHLDNWELAGYYAAFQGFPLKVLVTQQKHSDVNDLLNSYRECVGNTVIGKGLPIREMVAALKENSLVAIVGDQAGRKNDMYMRFFDRLATTHDGAFRIARRNRSAVLPCLMERLEGGRHRVSILDELTFGDGDDDASIHQAVQQYVTILENAIAQNPGQWMWGHKRWKHCKTKRVAIISDGKPGHENQSLAVYDMLRQSVSGEDGVPYEFKKKVVPVVYRSTVAKRIVQSCVWACASVLRGRLGLLRPFLTAESYDALASLHADIIISCGSAALPIALVLKNENMAKNVCVMRPPFPYSLVHHDIIITHAHDQMNAQQNIVETFLAPSRMTRERMELLGDDFRKTYALSSTTSYVALLIGGDTKGYAFDEQQFVEDIAAIISAAKTCGTRIVATNSRRTPRAVTQCLKRVLADSGIADMCVDVAEENPVDCVYGMMAVADTIYVTEESVSMTSEAVHSGKNVVVFSPSRDTLAEKHIRFQEVLIDKEVLERLARADVCGQLRSFAHKTYSKACIDENQHLMQQKLQGLL